MNLLLVEIAFWGPTHGEIRCSGRFTGAGGNTKDCPWCPVSYPQPGGLGPSLCGRSPALYSPSPEEGPGSRNSVPLAWHRQDVQSFHSSVQSMPKLSPAQFLSSSGWLSLCSRLCPGWLCAAAPRPALGPAWLPVHATATKRRPYQERPLLCFDYIT